MSGRLGSRLQVDDDAEEPSLVRNPKDREDHRRQVSVQAEALVRDVVEVAPEASRVLFAYVAPESSKHPCVDTDVGIGGRGR